MARIPGTTWADAFEMLERADRLHRQFFAPGPAAGQGACWQPPIDIFENEREVCIVAALPGVEPGETEIAIEGGALVVRGVRRLSPEARDAIRRLETHRALAGPLRDRSAHVPERLPDPGPSQALRPT
jgi:HSP20 family protein